MATVIDESLNVLNVFYPWSMEEAKTYSSLSLCPLLGGWSINSEKDR